MRQDESGMELTWSSRTLRPVILLYVTAVFVGFMALAEFVFHSREAVNGLAMAAVAGLASLIPSVLSRMEYRLTERGLEKRPVRPRKPQEFVGVFTWEELSHLVPSASGFKHFKKVQEPNPIRRFWKLHVVAGHSGEFQVEKRDREQVLAAFEERGVPIARGSAAERVGPGDGG